MKSSNWLASIDLAMDVRAKVKQSVVVDTDVAGKKCGISVFTRGDDTRVAVRTPGGVTCQVDAAEGLPSVSALLPGGRAFRPEGLPRRV